jgi:GT2 family glycosyltransferase
MREPRDRFVASTEKWDLLASSRILLNIHRDTAPYFEWVRVLEAMANGCLVLSECSSDYGPLLPGKHLLAVPYDTLNAYAVSIIADETLRAEIATAAYDFVRSELKFTSLLEPVCAHVEELALSARPVRKQSDSRPPRPTPPEAPSRAALAASLVADSRVRIRARAKLVLDSETALIQQVDALHASLRYGDPDYAEILTTRAWAECNPRVSVILTSYNYESFIVETIDSVMSSYGVPLELIVIDDRSDDSSVAVIREVMSDHDWFPMILMARAANVGQSLARNMGVARARGEFVFILDSDNAIYPTTLRKLSEALERAPDAAFSYGIIAKSERGLLSQFPWDVEHLCRGNYIDAMTMIRRSVLDEVGGLRSFWGWEDYELWCRLAANGHRAEFVPEIVAWYRVHSSNALHTTNLDINRLFRELRIRYPSLPWSEG